MPARKKPRYSVSRGQFSVEVRGKVYPSCGDCAEALGLTRGAIYSALSRGTMDTVGLGQHGPNTGRGGTPPTPYSLGPYKFPSMHAASLALGRDKRYIGQALRNGGKHAHNNLLRRTMAYVAKREQEERSKGDDSE